MSTTTTMPHYRRRALAGLDELIGRAEVARARCLASGGDAAAGGAAGGAARVEVLVGLADERLATLRRSRTALLADEAL